MSDHSESHAVLIGVSKYEDAAVPDVPSAANSLRDMHALLTDPLLCGWPDDRVTVIKNPSSGTEVARLLRGLAEETAGTLLIYFVGHGTLTRSGDLCLLVGSTEFEHPDITGLEYRHLSGAVRDSGAKSRIVILDCCYSGRAIPALSAGLPSLEESAQIAGAYTLTASDSIAHVPELAAQEHLRTSFTNAFINVVRDGIPDTQESLVLSAIYLELVRRLRAEGLPRPNQRGTDTISLFPFARNTAFNREVRNNEFALTVSDDTVYFDLAEISRQVMSLLQARPSNPLSLNVLADMREGGGFYQLSRVRGSAEEVVYLGTADRSLSSRLRHQWRKVSGRRNLSPDEMRFRHLYFDGDAAALLRPVLPGEDQVPSWNQNGFGNRDPGRARDLSALRYNHFDLLYPIDLSCLVGLTSGLRKLSLVLKEAVNELPFAFRVDRWAELDDDAQVAVPAEAMTADELFGLIAAAAGYAWQLTVLPGHVIFYRENRPYPSAVRYYRGTTVVAGSLG